MAIGAILGGIAGVASSLAPSIIGGLVDMRNTDKTNQANKDIASQNLAFDRQNLEYQQALQQQIFEREDTAYQRTVNDMRSAGLSPLSMQSTNGAGEVIQTTAPHNDYQAQKNNLGQIIASMPTYLDMMNVQANTDLIRAEARKTNAEAEEKEQDIAFSNEVDELGVPNWKATRRNAFNIHQNESFLSDLDVSERLRDAAYSEANNLYNSMTPDERRASLVAKSLGLVGSEELPSKTGNELGKLLLAAFGTDMLQSIIDLKGIGFLNPKKLSVKKE